MTLSGNNPLNFKDLFDFSDSGDLRNAIRDVDQLQKAYKLFLDTVANGQLIALADQQSKLAQSALDLADATKQLSVTNKASQQQLLANAQALADLEKKLAAVQAAQRGGQTTVNALSDSVDGLTFKLKEQLKQYNALSGSTDALKMKQLSADIGNTRNEISLLTAATNRTAASAQQAAGSYAQLDAQTKQLIIDLRNMAGGMDTDNAAAKALQAQILANTTRLKEFDSQIGQSFRNVGNYASAFDGLNSTLAGLGITLFSLNTIRQGFDKAFADTVKFDAFNKTIELVSGNSVEAAKNLAFIQQTAESLKLDISGLTQGFVKFSAATLGSQFEGQKTRDIFRSVSEAAAVLHLSADSTAGVFKALSDIISKGTVQAQELKIQLGNNLPGAFKLFADGLGVTTAELNKMLKSGQVASDTLVNFGVNLDKVFGPKTAEAVTSLQANVNEFNNTVYKTAVSGGLTDFFTAGVQGATAFVKELQQIGTQFSESKGSVVGFIATIGLLNISLLTSAAAWTKNTAAATLNAIATKYNSVVTAVATAATDVYWASIGVLTGSTTAATAATEIFNATIAANPIASVIILLGAVGIALANYNSDSEAVTLSIIKQNDALKESTKSIQDNTDELVAESDQLKNWKYLSEAQRQELEKQIQLYIELTKAKIKKLEQDKKEIELANSTLSVFEKLKLSIFTSGGNNQAATYAGEYTKALKEGKTAAEASVIATKASQKAYDDFFKNASDKKAADAVAPLTKNIQGLKDQLKDYDNNLEKVTDITHAYENALKINGNTISNLKDKVGLLTVARDNEISGTARYLAIMRDLYDTQNKLAKLQDKGIFKGFKQDDQQAVRDAKKAARDALAQEKKNTEDADKYVVSLNSTVRSGASAAVAAAKEEYAKLDAPTIQDQIDLANKILDIQNKSLDDRLTLASMYYGLDSKQYAELLAEKATAEKDNAETLAKIRKKEAADKDKERVRELSLDLDADKARIASAAESQVTGVKLKQAKGSITGFQAEDQIHEITKESYEDQIAAQVDALSKMTINDNGYLEKQKQLVELRKQLENEYNDYAIKKAQERTQYVQQLEQAGFQLIQQGVSSLVEIDKNKADAQIQTLQDQMTKEESLAGNNAAAKAAIEAKYQKQINALKRKQAIDDRTAALFNVGINTAVGISKTIADLGFPLAIPFIAIALAEGVVQTAAILSKPLPAYAIGREGGPAEYARLNERGPELIERNGNYRFENAGKDGIGLLRQGEKVHTAEKTRGILKRALERQEQEAFMRSQLSGLNVMTRREHEERLAMTTAISQAVMSPDLLASALGREISRLPITEHHINEDGYKRITRERNARITSLNERQKMGGKG